METPNLPLTVLPDKVDVVIGIDFNLLLKYDDEIFGDYADEKILGSAEASLANLIYEVVGGETKEGYESGVVYVRVQADVESWEEDEEDDG